jgi:4-hydroxy-tetrahydrodipicolinate synthase
VKFSGVICAVLTPFDANEELDETALRTQIEFLINAGIHGLLFTGGAGEFLNMEDSERKRVTETAVEQVRKRMPVIVGVLSPDTRHVCTLARDARKAGADAVMVLPPYYVSPSPMAIRDHYRRVADEGIPIVVYNNPARTNVNLDAAMLKELAKIEQVVAVKDCDRNLTTLSEKIFALGDRIQILSGEDDLALPTLLLGAPGGMWATVNLFPEIFVEMYQAVAAGNIVLARQQHYRLLPLWKACFVANHPAPLKAAMALASRPLGKARSPLASLSEEQLANVRSALAAVEQFA